MKLDEMLTNRHIPFERLHHRTAYTANRIAQALHVPGKEMAKTSRRPDVSVPYKPDARAKGLLRSRVRLVSAEGAPSLAPQACVGRRGSFARVRLVSAVTPRSGSFASRLSILIVKAPSLPTE